MSLEIRVLRVSDDDELFNQHIALMKEGVARHPAALIFTKYEMSPIQLREQIARKEIGIALAMLDGVAYGTISIYWPTYHKRRHKATISSMYVRTRAFAKALNGLLVLSHGLGYMLTLHMLERARKAGIETVVSNTSTTNYRIQQINEELGGRRVGLEQRGMKLEDGTYVDTITYEFNLHP